MSHTFSEETQRSTFLVTGGAGFIGSNIVAYLLMHKARKVYVLDNLATGNSSNLSACRDNPAFEFIEGDIRNPEDCRRACEGIDFISHQAALGSVPRSVKDPLTTHDVNSTGFLNMLIAARDAKVKRFVYASSSAVYGDHPGLPKKEELTGNPLSPYAATKVTNELYARVFAKTYSMEVIGLRYFNVFGPNQSPNAQYAAVIPLFMQSVIDNKSPFIDGNGEQTRDFTYIDNVVQANVLSMLTTNPEAINKVYNVAYGERISINQLFKTIAGLVGSDIKPIHRETRPGDVRDSLADISQAKKLFGYNPTIRIEEGLKLTLNWFEQSIKKSS